MTLSGSQRSLLVLIGQGWDVKDRGDDPVRFTQVLIGPYWSSLDRVGM